MTAPLIIDQYLSRTGVLERIDARTDADIGRATGRRYLSREHLAALVDEHAQDDVDVSGSKHDVQKGELIDRLGDVFDFDTTSDQDHLRKSQMVHVLLVLATDRTPDPFTVPSDPDDQTADQPDVPVLGAD